MAGYAKGVLIAVILTLTIVILMNFAFFFPWYITLVETTFEIAQVVSNENYLPYDTYEDIYEGLKSKPIFNDNPNSIVIDVTHEGTSSGSAQQPERDRNKSAEYYYDRTDKPYVQRGNVVVVTVSASYPFRMKFAGREITAADIPMQYQIKTTTLKHYKDLDYYTP